MKPALVASAVVAALAATASAASYVLSGSMDVFQATTNPSNTGNGTGIITGAYDDVTNRLDYSLSWQNLSGPVTNAHFHLGAPGVPGGVELGIPSPWASPYSVSGVTLNATQEANLLAGNWYVNLHTAAFGSGEIRGQVLVEPVPEPGSAALLLAGAGALSLRRRRGC